MSYHRKPSVVALGDLSSTIATLSSGLGAATQIASDPYLPETICRVGQLSAINNRQAVPRCVKAADGLGGGVGLRKLIKPLRAYVYAEQHPWVKPVAIAAAIGVPVFIGYLLGKGNR